MLLLVPLLVAGITFQVTLQFDRFPEVGGRLFRSLAWVYAFAIAALGIRHASRAVCWELSGELRELVRLTGIHPATLLWAQSVSRWLMIGVSLILMAPLMAYTRTVGLIPSERWIAAGWGLLLVAALTAAFAMIGSVSTTSAKNADTTAANVTFGLIAMYHGLIWGIGTILWFQRFAFQGRVNGVAHFFFDLAPIRQVYRALAAPDLFSPMEPAYWFHFPIAIAGMWIATILMRNRFHSEWVESESSQKPIGESTTRTPRSASRPRCSERPLLWKDIHILGGSTFSNAVWGTIVSLATVGAILAIAGSISFDNEASVVVAVLLTISMPWILALQFDSLMAAEFRDRTWGSLMLLPIHWLDPFVSKIQAAFWARRWVFLPIVIAAVHATPRAPYPMLIAFTITSLALPILIEVSVLSQFNAKKWWAGAMIGFLVILLIAAIVAVWVIFAPYPIVAMIMTVIAMASTIAAFLMHIRWRMLNWTGD